jgi:periplasmic protein TonB
VIAARPHRSGGQKNAHVQGWLVSVLLHGTVALTAILLMKQTPLVPQDQAFTWDVAMTSPAQPVQPTASLQNQDPASIASSKTTTPSSHVQESASSQTLPLPKPVARQTRPSISEQGITPMLTEVPPLQPTTPSQPVTHTTQPSEPIRHETVPSMVAAATSMVRPDEAPMAVSGESAAQTTPLNAPSAIFEHTAQSDEAPAPTQMAAISPAPRSTPAKRDYGWLSEAILRRVEELKRYPASARVDRAEGKVVVKAVINEDGNVGAVEVFQSSGHPGLDKAAIDTLRQAAPFHLPRPLGQPGMTIKIPMSYRLDR